jgi:hypothetical protein
MKTAILLTCICLGLSACFVTNQTMDGFKGQDRATIESRWGKPLMEYKDPEKGFDILCYNNINYKNLRSPERPAPRAKRVAEAYLLYMDKDNICYCWEELGPDFWSSFDQSIARPPMTERSSRTH